MTPERLREIEQFVRNFGPSNCWTGTVGTACTMLHELLHEQQRAAPTFEELAAAEPEFVARAMYGTRRR